MGEITQLGSMMAAVMFVWAIFQQLFPEDFRMDVRKYVNKVVSYVYPYVEITFHEYQGDSWFERSKAYVSIERYLSTNSSNRAKRLKANVVKDSQSVVLSMDDYEEVTDEFKGIKIWWTSSKSIPQQRALFSYRDDEEKRYYRLTCKRQHREIITNEKGEKNKGSEVTLSGLLNFIDGLWSACGSERPYQVTTISPDYKGFY